MKSLIESNKIFDLRSSADKVDKLLQIELKKIDSSIYKDAKIKKYQDLLHNLRVEIGELF